MLCLSSRCSACEAARRAQRRADAAVMRGTVVFAHLVNNHLAVLVLSTPADADADADANANADADAAADASEHDSPAAYDVCGIASSGVTTADIGVGMW